MNDSFSVENDPTVKLRQNFVFNFIDYCVFVIMLGASAGIGIYFGFFAKSKNTTEEYLRGGRKMKTFPIGISLVASQLSAVLIITIPTEAYSFGLHYFWSIFASIIALPVLCYVITPVFYNNNISNCYEYLEMRFDKRTRRIVTAAFLIKVYLMIPVYIFVPSLAFSQVTGSNVHLINAIVCSVCIFYTMLGGIKAVVWTDVVQATIMMGTIVLVAILAIIKVGGISEVFDRAYDGGRLYMTNTNFDLTTRMTVWNCFLGGFAHIISHVGVHQSCVQRIVSLPSIANAQKSLVIFTIGFFLFKNLNLLNGIIMYARYYLCDPVEAGIVQKADKLLPFFVQDIIGHLKGMPGLFISCVFSAALSTISANLNTLAGILYFDMVRPYINHTESRANFIMKIIVVINGIYCICGGFIVEQFKSIFQVVVTIGGITQGAVAGVFLLGMLYPKAHAKAAFYGTIFSMTTVAILAMAAQIQIKSGILKYEPLPRIVKDCDEFNITIIKEIQSTDKPDENPAQGYAIFQIAFYWYIVIGVALVWLAAVPLSHLIKNPQKDELNVNLLSPVIRNWLPKKLLRDKVPQNEN